MIFKCWRLPDVEKIYCWRWNKVIVTEMKLRTGCLLQQDYWGECTKFLKVTLMKRTTYEGDSG
jgi:hypothetical protein